MPESHEKLPKDSFDTPWKEILEAYFKDFMAFFLPIAHDNIDWERGYEFLDTELASITREAEIGDRRMDKLVKVWQRNPFSIVTLAHLQAKKTRNRPEDRCQAKLSLVRSLYKRGFSRQQVIDIFRFIDWVLSLPKEIDQQFRHEMLNFEENQKMPYISSVERIGMEIGRQEGAAVVFLRLLQRRFGPLSEVIHDTVKSADIASLELWSDKIFAARSIEEIFAN